MKKTLVIGELNTDLIVTGLEEFPQLGREILCGEFKQVLGSSSAIFASKLAGLGTPVEFMGLIGDDDRGRFVVSELQGNGVGTELIATRPDVSTGVGISLSFPEDRAIITYPGSIAVLSVEDIDLEVLSSYDHLHVASYFLQRGLQPGLHTIFARAHAEGLTISFDTGWDPDNAWGKELLARISHVDVFLPNEDEALALTGRERVEQALRALVELCPLVALKLGADGAVAQARDGEMICAAGYPAEVVDTTGAGDSFDAGFVFSYVLQGRSLAESLRFANACGALAVSHVGGASHGPTAEEVEEFIRSRET